MTTISLLIGISVGVLTIAIALSKMVFNFGKFAERFDALDEKVDELSKDVKQLKRWRNSNAVRNPPGRRGFPGNQQGNGNGES